VTQIVVSTRNGVLTAPDGTKHRVARGKTLADARHPAVLACPRDWSPMVVDLTVDGPAPGDSEPVAHAHEQIAQLENDVTELEETLSDRDREFGRLMTGLEVAGVTLPAEEIRQPGWLVDLVLAQLAERSADVPPIVVPYAEAKPLAPTKSRRRVVPPLATRTGDDD
jgi:hypothetical protein